MESNCAVVTFNNVVPTTLPEVAEMVVVPCPCVVARPEPEIVATPILLDAQVTDPVRFWVELSV